MTYYLSKWQNQFKRNLGPITKEQMFNEIEAENGNCTMARMMGKRFLEYAECKNQTPAYTIAVVMKNVKSAKQDRDKDKLNGLMYIDIDAKDHIGKSKDELESILSSFPYVGEIWNSFSGTGLAGLVYTTGNMTPENYTSTHKFLQKEFQKKGLKLDRQTSNYNRMHVQSNSIVRFREKIVTPLPVVVSKKRKTKVRKVSNFDAYTSDIIEDIYIKAISQEGMIEDGNRNRPLYVYVMDCLQAKIASDSVLSFIEERLDDSRANDECLRLINHIYKDVSEVEFKNINPIKVRKVHLHNTQKMFQVIYHEVISRCKNIIVQTDYPDQLMDFLESKFIAYTQSKNDITCPVLIIAEDDNYVSSKRSFFTLNL